MENSDFMNTVILILVFAVMLLICWIAFMRQDIKFLKTDVRKLEKQISEDSMKIYSLELDKKYRDREKN